MIKSRFSKHDPAAYAFATEGKSETQQQFQKECDVNNILAKYKKTKMLTHVNHAAGVYGDFSSAEDYQTSLHKVRTANESFFQLSSEVRSKFDNDPSKMISYIQDPKNHEEAIKFGLLQKIEKQPTVSESMQDALAKHDAKVKRETESSKK